MPGTDAVFATLDLGPDGGVNPPISDSSTFGFADADEMARLLDGELPGRFIYARVLTPSTERLGRLLAALEGTEAAFPTASGMNAIAATLLQLCSAGDEIVSAGSVYGGTYACFRHMLPRFGITTRFVDLTDHDAVRRAMSPRTRVLYCESLSNPLLETVDLAALAAVAHEHGAALVVDNTFAPGILAPAVHGADVVIHSLTKYINGMSDGLGGVICASEAFVTSLLDLRHGVVPVLGGTLDGERAARIAKHLHTLGVRMRHHGETASCVARRLHADGLPVHYPGLPTHPSHERMRAQMLPGSGFGGILTVDAGDATTANAIVGALREAKVGFAAVSLGYFRTLFTVPTSSTASELSDDHRRSIALSPGLIRISVGLEPDADHLAERISQIVARHC